MTPRLEMSGVSKRFGATLALQGVDLSVAPGEVHALVGENGAGKSTLMKVLSGAIQPDTGAMRLDGQPYAPRNPLEARHAGVAMIYQELSLALHLSVEENIVLGMEPSRLGLVNRRDVRQKALDALRQLDHPEIHPATQVMNLSIAARQITEIARALAIGCRVLILDEPTSSLTRTDTEHLFRLIEKLAGQGHAIVYISHFLEEVKRVCDRLTVLRDGKTVYTGDVETISSAQIVTHMVGRQLQNLYPRSPRTASGVPVLEIANLAGRSKPESATLTLYKGEVLGIAGLVGAGRTELLRTIFGLDQVRSGQIRLTSYVGPYSPARRWAQGAGLLSEDRKSEGLALSRSIADNMTLSRLPALITNSRQQRDCRPWIERLAIKCRSSRQSVSDLSGGNQQKVAIARLLHHDVDVLLLDEPTRGIDVASKAQIYRIIDELASAGKAVLIVSSYLPELLGICDRIAVMHRGRLGNAHPVSEVDEHKLLLEATGATAAA